MKCLFIIPPCTHPDRPYYSAPLLSGQIEGKMINNQRCESKILDLNVEFFNYILTSEYFKKIKKDLLADVIKLKDKDKLIKKIDFIEKYIEEAVRIYKTDLFYQPKVLYNAMKVTSMAFEIISLIAYGYSGIFGAKQEMFELLTPARLEKYSEDRNRNIFYNFYVETIDTFINEKYDFISITVPFAETIIPAFTLTKLLKKKYEIPIVIGGGSITRCAEEYKKNIDFFKTYCDYIIIGDGDKSIIDFAKYIKKEITPDKVSGLIYKECDKIISNEPQIIEDFKDFSPPSFNGIDFNKYLVPEPVIPIMASKGCYWGKCTFCDFSYKRKFFNERPVEELVSEIKLLQRKYNISKFEFIDDAVSPEYLGKFAEEIIKQNVKIKYSALVRTEKEFTKTLLKKIVDSGCTILNWGYETHCERILKLMNKGTLGVNREKILKDSAEVGIWNHVFFIFDFPTETDGEWKITKKFIFDNEDIIDSFSTNTFKLYRHSTIEEHRKEFGINDEYVENEFSPELETKNQINASIKKQRLDVLWQELYETRGYKAWNILTDLYSLLYVSKIGKEKTKNTIIHYNN